MNHLLGKIRENINGLSDNELLDIITLNKSEYTQEALELAIEEITKRGLSIPAEAEDYQLEECDFFIYLWLNWRSTYAITQTCNDRVALPRRGPQFSADRGRRTGSVAHEDHTGLFQSGC